MFGVVQSAFLALVGTPTAPSPEQPVVNVKGEHPEVVTRVKNGETLYACGDVSTEAKLPEGYPRPTPPGVIELKYYPSVRRAEFTADAPSARNAGRVGFMPLFRHISERNIAMTAPVEMDYADDSWTMSFLYETIDDGPTGQDGRVRVIDTEPVVVVSIGLAGSPRGNAYAENLAILEQWIKDNRAWERAGNTRTMGYNGPSVPEPRKWSEIQIPVRQTRPANEI